MVFALKYNPKIKKIALEAVRHAGKMAAREFARFDRASITLKSHHEILTKVDLASEKNSQVHLPAYGFG